jgi:hypothetical protein
MCINTSRGYLYLDDATAERLGITPTLDRWITPLEVTDKVVQVRWLDPKDA